jgi:hypothetical protein
MFLFVTKEVSKNTTPRIHEVIPFIDRLTDAMDDYASNLTLPNSICIAAKRGSIMMNKYYAKTDESIMFRIAMSVYILMPSTVLTTIFPSPSSALQTWLLLKPEMAFGLD